MDGAFFYYVGLGHFNNCSRTFFTELFYRKQNQLFIVTILYIDGFSFFSISLKKLQQLIGELQLSFNQTNLKLQRFVGMV